MLASPNDQSHVLMPSKETGVNSTASSTQAGLGTIVKAGLGSDGAMTFFVNVDSQPFAVVTVNVTVYEFPVAYVCDTIGLGPDVILKSPNVHAIIDTDPWYIRTDIRNVNFDICTRKLCYHGYDHGVVAMTVHTEGGGVVLGDGCEKVADNIPLPNRYVMD